MELYGVRGTALDWFESYLKDRSIRVKCHTEENNRVEYSQTYSITYGTPQGSCLGPLLFLIFCNDIHMHLQHTSCILFADDTTLYFTHRNMNYLKWCIQEDLNILADWFRANKLTLNVSKTVYMTFNVTGCNNINLVIGDEKLPYVTSTKFLGIWLDSGLSWNEHLSKLHTRLKQNQNLIRLGKNMLSTGAKRNVYYAHIHSHLSYGLVTWGNMINNTQLNKIQKAQDSCMRLLKPKELPSKTRKQLKILNFKDMIKLENYKFGHKLQNKMLPPRIIKASQTDSRGTLTTKQHKYPTRHKKIPNLPKTSNKKYRSSFLYKSITDLQTLPLEILELQRYDQFTKNCKHHLLKTY